MNLFMPITHSLSLKVHARTCIKTPVGFLSLASCMMNGNEYICSLAFSDENENRTTPFFHDAETQLQGYFAGSLRIFDIPFIACGTAFQLSVWSALTQIPYGVTCSYSDIAQAIGRPKAARAIGMACHFNPVSIIIPCHRIVGKNGSLTGFGGGLDIKAYLLALEGSNCR